MEILVGKTAGFCFGVNNAVTKAKEELKKGGKLYGLGELVHNLQVTEDLENRGMIFVDDIKETQGKVIIRAHGIPKEIYKQAEEMNVKVIDLTCPNVLHIHNIAETYAQKGYFIFLTGKAEHPEMLGTVSFCGTNYAIIEKEEDVNKGLKQFIKSNKTKAILISQTTYSLEKFEKIVERFKTEIIRRKP